MTHKASLPIRLVVLVFALFYDTGRHFAKSLGTRSTATLADSALGLGCFLSAWMQSYLGLILGFGVLGGIQDGLGYAAATPAAVKWFGPERSGLIVGLVVSGYGACSDLILCRWRMVIDSHGLRFQLLCASGHCSP